MPNTQLSDAVVFPEDDGTGVPDGSEDYLSAGYLASLPHVQTAALLDGLAFTTDYAASSVSIGAGVAALPLPDVDVQSGSQELYDTTLPSDAYQLVVLPSDVGGLALDTGVNDVWLAHDPSSQDSVYVRHGSSVSEPGDPAVKLGVVDTESETTRGRWYAALPDGTLSFPDEAAATSASEHLPVGMLVYDRAASTHYAVTQS